MTLGNTLIGTFAQSLKLIGLRQRAKLPRESLMLGRKEGIQLRPPLRHILKI